MLTALASALTVGLGLALAALPIVLIPIALAGKRPAGVVRAFLAGWFVGIVLAGALVISVADVVVLPTGNSAWLSVVKIVLGLVLVILTVSKWLSRPRAGEEPELPRWMAQIGSMTSRRAFGVALALAALNPKNLVIVAGGATVIADATPRPGEQLVALIVFAVVGSAGVGAPVVLRMVIGERADGVLQSIDRWMTRYSTVLVAAVLGVLGVVLIVNGVTGL